MGGEAFFYVFKYEHGQRMFFRLALVLTMVPIPGSVMR